MVASLLCRGTTREQATSTAGAAPADSGSVAVCFEQRSHCFVSTVDAIPVPCRLCAILFMLWIHIME